MRTRLPVEELLRLAQEGSRQGHYGTFMARGRELGSKVEEEAFKEGYLTGLRDKVTADKTQHKPLLEQVQDEYSPWGLYNDLTKAMNEGKWEPDEVLDVVQNWLHEQDNRSFLLHYVVGMLVNGRDSAKDQLKPAETQARTT